METTVAKNKEGYGYKYTDLAQIHDYLEKNNMSYYQYVETFEGKDYIVTVPIIDGQEQKPRRGVQIVDAVLNGIKNPAQEQGSATTYARRYSLLMAFGLATEDDDAASLTRKKGDDKKVSKITEIQAKALSDLMTRKGVRGADVKSNLEKAFGLSSISELSQNQYAILIKKLNDMKDKINTEVGT